MPPNTLYWPDSQPLGNVHGVSKGVSQLGATAPLRGRTERRWGLSGGIRCQKFSDIQTTPGGTRSGGGPDAQRGLHPEDRRGHRPRFGSGLDRLDVDDEVEVKMLQICAVRINADGHTLGWIHAGYPDEAR